MKKILLMFSLIVIGLFLLGCTSQESLAGEAISYSSTSSCKSFQASQNTFNSNDITGDQLCKKSNWGKCHAVITTNWISYSYDQSSAFFTSATLSKFVDCNINLKSSENDWIEIIHPWNPFNQTLFQKETKNIAGGSALCCK